MTPLTSYVHLFIFLHRGPVLPFHSHRAENTNMLNSYSLANTTADAAKKRESGIHSSYFFSLFCTDVKLGRSH